MACATFYIGKQKGTWHKDKISVERLGLVDPLRYEERCAFGASCIGGFKGWVWVGLCNGTTTKDDILHFDDVAKTTLSGDPINEHKSEDTVLATPLQPLYLHAARWSYLSRFDLEEGISGKCKGVEASKAL